MAPSSAAGTTIASPGPEAMADSAITYSLLGSTYFLNRSQFSPNGVALAKPATKAKAARIIKGTVINFGLSCGP